MKKLVFLLAIVSTMFMVSCEKDDIIPDNPNNNTNEVVDLVCEVTHTDVTSFGGDDGTITVTVKSGNPPYEFILDGVTKDTSSNTSFTFTNLTAGVYKVGVKDSKDKTFNKDVTVNEGDETFGDLVIGVEVTHNDFDNNSGVIEVTVTGGKEPYSFFLNDVEWNDNVFTNLGGGTYTVTVKDANNDEVSKSVEVLFGFDIVVVSHTNSNNMDSNNGQIVLGTTYTDYNNYEYSVDGGATWSYNNVFNNLNVGVYSVSVKDEDGRVRPETEMFVEIEDDYNGYRVGELYTDDDGFVGVVFEVLGDEVRIADTQHFGINMSFGQYTNARLVQINEQVTNGEWITMNISTLTTYLEVAKDSIDSGNVFNVEVYVNTHGQRNRYWSTSIYNNDNQMRSVARIENGNVLISGEVPNNNNDVNMRGRYVATRPNIKN